MTLHISDTDSIDAVVHSMKLAQQACSRIAPSWPLDQMIAVNPWWEMRSLPMSDVTARIKALGDANALMSKAWYRSQYPKQIKPEYLNEAIKQSGMPVTELELLDYLKTPEQGRHWCNMCDLLDALPGQHRRMDWHDEVVHQISQFCSLYFQYPERMQNIKNRPDGFYQAWLEVIRQDKGVEILMRQPGLREHFHQLPMTVGELFDQVSGQWLSALSDQQSFVDYMYALLLDVHGWASWMAYVVWQDNFEGRNNNLLMQLLAVRLAWDWVLWRQCERDNATVRQRFQRQFSQYSSFRQHWLAEQKKLWVWQLALELSVQQPLQQKLTQPPKKLPMPPVLQAVFCIDVRSEPMRRALEQVHPAIQTFGTAGFFGLPLSYQREGTEWKRPQLPGLFAPVINAIPVPGGLSNDQNQRRRSHRKSSWLTLNQSGPASFGLVEAKGILKLLAMFKRVGGASDSGVTDSELNSETKWQLIRDEQVVSESELVPLLANILKSMGLTQSFSRTVLLVGHGSDSNNNPQACGLDCGACGGQSGEVNVRVLADLLNRETIRTLLHAQGIGIPETTRFVACLHNTTTEELLCLDQNDGEPWRPWLKTAERLVRRERAGLEQTKPLKQADRQLKKLAQRRSKSWSQLRPEWGLVNNSSFIIAPRDRTRAVDLQGRSFLHEYNWQPDNGFQVLEQIMTGPLIVTNWINLQYYASMTDNKKYGSGNKLLHNVVGGHIGLFEGNGGDLRIGLPMQSLHDGVKWRHQPVRLGVYIEAPRLAIGNVIQRHSDLADLVNNEWLTIYQIDTESSQIWQYRQQLWHPC